MVRFVLAFAVVVGVLWAKPGVAQMPDSSTTDTIVVGCRHVVGEFQALLQAEFAATKEDGDSGIPVNPCLITAHAAARDLSSLAGWRIHRTAMRLRNPRNAPDRIEARALAVMEEDSVDEFVTWESDSANHQQLRYVSAIRLGTLCVGCHGEEARLAKPVKAALKELYPDDQATGFKPGDLRGAFSITVDWPEGRSVADSLYRTIRMQKEENPENDGMK